jgi:hypothetical protein
MMTIEQRSGAPVTYDGKVLADGRLLQNLSDRADDPALRRDRSFPAPDTCFWVGKERVGSHLKLSAGEVARCRSVTFAEIINDTVSTEPESFGQDFSGVSCLALAACKNATDDFDPVGTRQRAHTCSATFIERPIRNRDARINCNIRVGDEENYRQGDGPLGWSSSLIRTR